MITKQFRMSATQSKISNKELKYQRIPVYIIENSFELMQEEGDYLAYAL